MCLLVLGSNPDVSIERSDVMYMGNINHRLCLEVFSMADVMLHLAWLDHCPNVVVEAISQKCPVICTDSGGTKELVGTGGLIIPETTQYKYELTDYDNPYSLDLSVLSKVDLEGLVVDLDNIDLQKSADQYEKVLFDNENIFVSP